MTWVTDQILLAAVARFVYTSSHVALINVSSGEITELAEGRCPTPSPDRTRVAWIPGPSSVGDIWILDVQTRERRRLTFQVSAQCARWSPDGRYLAVVSPASNLREEIMIVAAETGRTEFVLAPAEERLFAPAWHPDSRRLAFAVAKMKTVTIGTSQMTFPDTAKQIDLMDIRDRRRSPVLRITGAGGVSELAVSPDGQRLLFRLGTNINLAAGGTITPLAAGRAPAWHPAGTSIIFTRGYDCTGGVCAGDDLYSLSF